MNLDPTRKCKRRLWGNRKMWVKLSCGALSVFVGLVLGEMLVRILMGAPMPERLPTLHVRANPERGWELIANSEHYTYRHRVDVNSLGLRGPELQEAIPGETRVFVLGDSLVFGQGVSTADTIPAKLEQILNDEGGNWRVVNGGIRAYSTNQELALLQELGPTIAPDVVVLCWYWNDIEEIDIQSTYQSFREVKNIPFDLDYHTEGWGRLRWQGRQIARSSALLMLLHDHWHAWRSVPPSQSEIDEYLENLSRYLDVFNEACRELQCRFELVIIPDPAALAGSHFSDSIASQARELAESKDTRVIDMKPALRSLFADSGKLPTIPFDGHYDASANEKMARKLAWALREWEIAASVDD